MHVLFTPNAILSFVAHRYYEIELSLSVSFMNTFCGKTFFQGYFTNKSVLLYQGRAHLM